jgi:hypothetical protein
VRHDAGADSSASTYAHPSFALPSFGNREQFEEGRSFRDQIFARLWDLASFLSNVVQ